MRCLIVLPLLFPWLTTAVGIYYTPSEISPAPRQAGWDHTCTYWGRAQKDDTCWGMAQILGISIGHFQTMNPQLANDCVHNLWTGYWYCLGYGPDPAGATKTVTPDSTATATAGTSTVTNIVTASPNPFTSISHFSNLPITDSGPFVPDTTAASSALPCCTSSVSSTSSSSSAEPSIGGASFSAIDDCTVCTAARVQAAATIRPWVRRGV